MIAAASEKVSDRRGGGVADDGRWEIVGSMAVTISNGQPPPTHGSWQRKTRG